MIDYHIHYHQHGESGPYEMERLERVVEVARRKGLVEVGLSEHVFRFVEFAEVIGDWWNDTDDPQRLKDHCKQYVAEHATQSVRSYLDLIREAQARGLAVKAGIEVDYYPGRMERVSEFLFPLDLDFVLGSVHWLGAWGFDNEEVSSEWEKRDPDDIYEQYFDHLVELATTGVAHVLAHPDLPKKFGHRPRRFDLNSAFARLVKVCSELGVGVEVSSAGWRMPAHEQYPAVQLLQIADSNGIQLTTASDAHVPELVGHRIDELCGMLGSLGCRAVYGYRRGRPVRFALRLPDAIEGGSHYDDQ